MFDRLAPDCKFAVARRFRHRYQYCHEYIAHRHDWLVVGPLKAATQTFVHLRKTFQAATEAPGGLFVWLYGDCRQEKQDGVFLLMMSD